MSTQPRPFEINLPFPGETPMDSTPTLDAPSLEVPSLTPSLDVGTSAETQDDSSKQSTWSLGRIAFQNEVLPNIRPEHYTPEGFPPVLQEIADDSLRAAMRGELPGLLEDPQADLPHLATTQDLAPIERVEPVNVDINFLAGEAASARTVLASFNSNGSSFIEQQRQDVKYTARVLATKTAFLAQMEDWFQTASSNNELLANRINEVLGTLVEQKDYCDTVYDRSESIQAQLNMLGFELDRLGIHDETLELEIAKAQANARATDERFRMIDTRVKQIQNVASKDTAIKLEDAEMFKVLSLARTDQEREQYRQMVQNAIDHPGSTDAQAVRALLPKIYHVQGGLRDQILNQQADISRYIQLTHTDRVQNEAKIAGLLDRQAVIGQQLLELVRDIYNPALDELTRLCEELGQCMALAQTRRFQATPIPQQIAAAQESIEAVHRRLEIESQAAAQPQTEGKQPATREEVRATRQQEQRGRLIGKLMTRFQR